ncbi:aspartate aminotransferase family protein [Mycolicibacterium baixiangningiae]|uniref:aspartate aminotransferase family protein n=1 Tax=Mycolicibacterium baixiangningiae TaxID=2761578 RepID=UPI0018D12E8F|nr:aminotransferase class III-fold pyridoxal phosphate-dependent enzyme [Mycolicibacterium baixiangningiae]
MAPTPPYAVRGEGCRVWDQLGHEVVDCNNNYTSLIHGHGFAPVVDALAAQAPLGTAFGLPTESEIALAEILATRTMLPQWRFTNSGSEAVMAAIRAARAYTGRELVVRFEGSYHGTYDAAAAPNARGVPAAVRDTSVPLPQGDFDALATFMQHRGHEVAAVIVDLMPNRAGLVPATSLFVQHVRDLTRRHGALLHIDEVITFRLEPGGMHTRYDIAPDLVTLGKVIGGGLPIGALGGTTDVMAVFDPTAGIVSWGGTFSANPLSMMAGIAALTAYDEGAIADLNVLGDRLRDELATHDIATSGSGSLIRLHVPVDATRLWWELYAEGVLAGANGLLALSTAMGAQDIDRIKHGVITGVGRVPRQA